MFERQVLGLRALRYTGLIGSARSLYARAKS